MRALLAPDASVGGHAAALLGHVEVDATELFSGGEGVEQHAEPFFHTAPGAPLDGLTARFLARQRKRWEALNDAGALTRVARLRIDLDAVRNITVPLHINLVWPSVAHTRPRGNLGM